ncbi:MAG TPA: hypothetical protein VF913_06690 [Xanthobacteraceae bacterium]
MRSPEIAAVVAAKVEEIWLTLEEFAEQRDREERKRRKRLWKRFGIPATSWDIAAAPACARFWRWSGEPVVVGAFWFEHGCRDYWASYLVLPQPHERLEPADLLGQMRDWRQVPEVAP